MNCKTLKKKYPGIWDEVYNLMITDLCSFMPGAEINQFKDGNKSCRIMRIAHNAAFLACDAIRKNKKLIKYNVK